jgi:hypothetical protein
MVKYPWELLTMLKKEESKLYSEWVKSWILRNNLVNAS